MERLKENTVFHLQLTCTSRKSLESETLSLSSFPSSTLELKKAIEDKFSIPVCVQSLSCQLAPLTDSDNLVEKRLRSGDTLSVSYLCEGECQLLREIIKWLQELLTAIHSMDDAVAESLTWRGIDAGYHEVLPVQLFDWLNPKAYVNKLYFEAEGGLKFLIEIYKELASREWSEMRPLYKHLESFSIQSIGNFGENFPLRRMTLKEGVLDLVMTSLLRKELRPGEPIEGFGQTGDFEYERQIWRELLTDAVYIVSNFSELPECQLQIASRPCVLEQVLCVSMSQQCPCSTSVVVAEIFVCLAHSTTTHQYLSKPHIVEGLLQVYEMRSKCDSGQQSVKDQQTLIALKCFTLVTFAQLALVSSHLIPSQFMDTVLEHMNEFLVETQPETIKTYEQDHECVWATLLPYVKLFYLPENSMAVLSDDSVSNQKMEEPHRITGKAMVSSQTLYDNSSNEKPIGQRMEELQQTSEMIILFFLHSKMSRQYSCDILIKEGLVDYITALPWHVSAESKALAKTVVSELSGHLTQLQPPKLCSIVQAKLAKMCFGLGRIVASNSPVDLIRYLCQNPTR